MSTTKGSPTRGGSPDNVVRLHKSVLQYAERLLERSTRQNRLFIPVEARSQATVPLVGGTVRAGFPSPADDYVDRPLCFNELLIKNPAATFAVRVGGDSMVLAGIFPGDIAVVDRSIAPKNRNIILALVNNEFTIKRYRRKNGRVWLQAENPTYSDIPIDEDTQFEVWGVVRHAIRVL